MSDQLPSVEYELSFAELGALETQCRHAPAVRLLHREIIEHTQDGIPCLASELVLLFKAGHARPKHRSDFEADLEN